ncbi:MAG: DUF86 domain-containing protein [Alphaproteobacteria bacterium]|nr:DUF86 domain-containing protein [Alphaproteobacteria bacterium]
MLPEARDRSVLLDMLEQCRGISVSVEGRSFSAYCADENLRYALERRIEILGEAAKRLSDSIRNKHPEIPWQKIVAMRNILAHEYGEVEDEIVWRVTQTHIPELTAQVEVIVSLFSKQE